jgi:hypothetical protein
MQLSRFFSYIVLFLAFVASGFAECGGTERWGVKDGTDTDSRPVNLNDIKSISIAQLISIQEPHLPPRDDNETRLSEETHVYRVKARLVKWKEEAGETGDSDYHLVLTDDTLRFTEGRGTPTGHSVIGEIPDPDCLSGAHGNFGNSSPFLPANPTSTLSMRGARNAMNTQFPDAVFDGSWNDGGGIPVEVIGVGYFDPAHGQVGRAPNNIEIHPILSITFSGQQEDVANVRVVAPKTAGLTSLSRGSELSGANTEASPIWQYTMITAESADRLLTSANALGTEGWEMVNVAVDANRPDRYLAYLKRLRK